MRRLPASMLSGVDPVELAEQADTWLSAITDELSRFSGNRPRATALAEAGLTLTLEPCTLTVGRGVVWVTEPPRGASLYMDIVDHAELAEEAGHQDIVVPLTRTSWLTLFDRAAISCSSSETLAQQNELLPALAAFHMVAFALERINRQLAVVDNANLERARTASRRTAEKAARQRLFNIYDLPIERAERVEDTVLADALQVIGRHEGIEFKLPVRPGPSDTPFSLVDVLDASGVRARRVRFREEGSWWRSDKQRDTRIPCRGWPARSPAAGSFRALPGSRSRQQAQCPGLRRAVLKGSRRRPGCSTARCLRRT